MKIIPVEEAAGTILAHDLTRIDPGKFKGVAFKKGHVVTRNDIPLLKRIGKVHLYILEIGEDQLHEDNAALRIAPAIAGSHLTWTDPREGKSNLVADCNGLLNVNVDALREINKLGAIIVATLKTGTPCKKGQIVAATRIIPLTIKRQKIERLEELALAQAPILEVVPYRRMRFGGVVTGSEVAKGLIPDEFEAYVGKKAEAYGCEFVKKIIVPDDPDVIANAVRELKDCGCELILTTGGLSVDPDDVTREGVRRSGPNAWLTEVLYSPVPCFFGPAWMMSSFWVCRPASSTTVSLSTTCCYQKSWPDRSSPRIPLLIWATGGCVCNVRCATFPIVLLGGEFNWTFITVDNTSGTKKRMHEKFTISSRESL